MIFEKQPSAMGGTDQGNAHTLSLLPWFWKWQPDLSFLCYGLRVFLHGCGASQDKQSECGLAFKSLMLYQAREFQKPLMSRRDVILFTWG